MGLFQAHTPNMRGYVTYTVHYMRNCKALKLAVRPGSVFR
jgi:hypothetical protein